MKCQQVQKRWANQPLVPVRVITWRKQSWQFNVTPVCFFSCSILPSTILLKELRRDNCSLICYNALFSRLASNQLSAAAHLYQVYHISRGVQTVFCLFNMGVGVHMFSSLFISCMCILLILYVNIYCCSKWSISGSLDSLLPLLLHVLLARSDFMKAEQARFQ